MITVFCSGGRFKKEVVLDGQSYLLLIRDEGGLPEVQVCVHADDFVFRHLSFYIRDLSGGIILTKKC